MHSYGAHLPESKSEHTGDVRSHICRQKESCTPRHKTGAAYNDGKCRLGTLYNTSTERVGAYRPFSELYSNVAGVRSCCTENRRQPLPRVQILARQQHTSHLTSCATASSIWTRPHCINFRFLPLSLLVWATQVAVQAFRLALATDRLPKERTRLTGTSTMQCRAN